MTIGGYTGTNWGTSQPLIKYETERKPENYYIKTKLHRNTMSAMSDFYDYNMSLFENGEPEEFLQCLQNFKMSIEEPGKMQ